MTIGQSLKEIFLNPWVIGGVYCIIFLVTWDVTLRYLRIDHSDKLEYDLVMNSMGECMKSGRPWTLYGRGTKDSNGLPIGGFKFICEGE